MFWMQHTVWIWFNYLMLFGKPLCGNTFTCLISTYIYHSTQPTDITESNSNVIKSVIKPMFYKIKCVSNKGQLA